MSFELHIGDFWQRLVISDPFVVTGQNVKSTAYGFQIWCSYSWKMAVVPFITLISGKKFTFLQAKQILRRTRNFLPISSWVLKSSVLRVLLPLPVFYSNGLSIRVSIVLLHDHVGRVRARQTMMDARTMSEPICIPYYISAHSINTGSWRLRKGLPLLMGLGAHVNTRGE